MKSKSSIGWFEFIGFFLFPVLIGAAFNFVGVWLGIPTLLVLGILWIGILSKLWNSVDESKAKP